MPIYKTSGTLTGTIEPGNVSLAQEYLQSDDMTQFLDEPLKAKVERIQWHLNADGETWYVEAFTPAPLSPVELDLLALWVSGQNSDGLGEGFEQQEFAEIPPEDEEDFEDWGMISFDWETNKCKFERVK